MNEVRDNLQMAPAPMLELAHHKTVKLVVGCRIGRLPETIPGTGSYQGPAHCCLDEQALRRSISMLAF